MTAFVPFFSESVLVPLLSQEREKARSLRYRDLLQFFSRETDPCRVSEETSKVSRSQDTKVCIQNFEIST